MVAYSQTFARIEFSRSRFSEDIDLVPLKGDLEFLIGRVTWFRKE